MISGKARLAAQNFPVSARRIFSGKILQVKASPNHLGYNRYAWVSAARRIKKAAQRHFLKRKVIARAAKLPNIASDILFIALSLPASKRELDEEFDRIRNALL